MISIPYSTILLLAVTLCACVCVCVDAYVQRSVFTLATLPEGWNGISDEVFLSIPVCIGEKGITHLVSQKLSESELAKVQQSAQTLRHVMDDIQL